MAILTELRDPRIQDVTVTNVEVLPDMRSAKVQVSIMGTEAKQQLCLRGLQNAAGFLQQCVSDRIDTRYTPRLQFSLDQGVKKSIEVSRMLRELLPAESAESAEPGTAVGDGAPAAVVDADSQADDEDADDASTDDADGDDSSGDHRDAP